jgi:hypothetical protein
MVKVSLQTATQITEGEEREVEESMYKEDEASITNQDHQSREWDATEYSMYAPVMCYHHQYDLNSDYNPLIDYGALDGVLPGTTVKASMIIRDMVIHWEWPHLELEWERLPEAIAESALKHFRPEDTH